MPVAVERDLARLRSRLGAASRRPGSPPQRLAPVQSRSRLRAWVGWAIAAQILLVLLLSAQIAFQARPGEYRSLAAAPSAGTRIMVMFRPKVANRSFAGC